MNVLMRLITRLVDIILYPFSSIAPVWGIAFLSLLTALFVLLVYKKVSRQKNIRDLKKKIQGHFLGIYLFRDDIKQILACQGRVLSNTIRYMCHALLPLAIAIAPVFLLCVQMQLRYGHSSLKPGQSVFVSAGLEGDALNLMSGTRLLVSGGLVVQSQPLRIAGANEIDWRVGVTGSGTHQIRIEAGRNSAGKTIYAGDKIKRIYVRKDKPSFWQSVIYPGEETIEKGSPIKYIQVDYPPARVDLGGLKLHWSIAYFALAMIFGLLLKRSLKVEF